MNGIEQKCHSEQQVKLHMLLAKEKISKNTLHTKMEGKRARGRPRTRMDEIA